MGNVLTNISLLFVSSIKAEFGRTVFGHASSIVTAALAKADVSSEPTIAPAVSEGLPSSKTRPSDSLKVC